ncbi:MAG: amidohydrolase [Proteobacteria bacterium]|nr:amidohydrolase [Pseudomonadota bacterium]
MKLLPALLLLACQVTWSVHAADLQPAILAKVDADYPRLFDLYRHLHTHPEISFQEVQTAARIADELKQAGFEVTTKFGGNGIVGVLRNGPGPTVLVRTDLDGLPVLEETGLPYASKARTKDDKGNDVPVMHACAHDIHMASFIGTARVLATLRAGWSGTLVFIGQPAEERVGGAKSMLAAGLYTRFPRPDFCLALHAASDLPAGTIGYTEGYALANADTVDILVRGVSGHGAWPHMTKDPIVLSAQIILGLQTIVSRETSPTDPAVVTVGSIHGGTKHNIIPEEVRLQLTLRSYSDEVREHSIAALKRIVRGQALAAGIPEKLMPVVEVSEEGAKSTFNDPALTKRLMGAIGQAVSEGNLVAKQPVMGAEDFGLFGRTEPKIPICMFWLGTITKESVTESIKTGKTLPSLHSSKFAPVPEPTLKTGVTAMTAAVLELVGKK